MERDYSKYNLLINILNFNSHAHVERDATSTAGGIAGFNFNSHAHVERDLFMF